MKFEYIIAFFLILIIGFFIYKHYFLKENLKNIEKRDESRKERLENNGKVLQYFGGDYCPFSNSDSNAYKVIKDFEDEYGNKVYVKYYWVGKDDAYMKQLNVEYVPAILNGNNESIELALPENTETKDMSTNDIKTLLLETIYNKL
jgi:hypothetical protein